MAPPTSPSNAISIRLIGAALVVLAMLAAACGGVDTEDQSVSGGISADPSATSTASPTAPAENGGETDSSGRADAGGGTDTGGTDGGAGADGSEVGLDGPAPTTEPAMDRSTEESSRPLPSPTMPPPSSEDFDSGATTAAGDALEVAPPDEEPPGPVPPIDPVPPEQLVSLNAGSVDDNERWTDYLLYLDDFAVKGIPHSPIDVGGRHVVTIVDRNDRPVINAVVELVGPAGVVSSARTASDGRALVFVPASSDVDQQQVASPWDVRVSYGAEVAEIALDLNVLVHTYGLDVDGAVPPQLDVLFLIDATGSMGDEIERLKANMVSVAEQIDALPGNPDVRFGLTTYRDRGDEYISQPFDFTGDLPRFLDDLSRVAAVGGGDDPEDLITGLHDALAEPVWRTDGTVRLIFLLADAPPHLDYGQFDYADEIQVARDMGVKITPIASSGTDAQAEFIFRQMAQTTMGRFLFLTYGADGASPGTETDLNVDDFSVLALDELVVKVVTEEMAALNT